MATHCTWRKCELRNTKVIWLKMKCKSFNTNLLYDQSSVVRSQRKLSTTSNPLKWAIELYKASTSMATSHAPKWNGQHPLRMVIKCGVSWTKDGRATTWKCKNISTTLAQCIYTRYYQATWCLCYRFTDSIPINLFLFIVGFTNPFSIEAHSYIQLYNMASFVGNNEMHC